MEVYLVKEEVKVLRVRDAFSKTMAYNNYVNALELGQQLNNETVNTDDSDESDEASEEVQDDNLTVLKLYDLPVALRSACSDVDVNVHSEQFAKRVETKLARKEANFGFEWENINLKLIIIPKDRDHPNAPEGYLVLSPNSADGSVKLNVFTRLYEEIDFAQFDFTVQVSLCHLPSENAPVSPEALVRFEVMDEFIYYCSTQHLVGSDNPVQVPRQLMEWSEQGTGFIYCKTSVKVCLVELAVDRVYGYLDENLRLLEDQDFTDVEMGCKTGEIVKCHRAILADKSCVLRRKLKEILGEGKRDGNVTLKMELSKGDVEPFLEYMYCGRVSAGMWDCDLALELLKAGRQYQVVGLEGKMEEIMMAKRSGDFDYFTVKSALDLFLYARGVVGLKHLRDKAVRVLKNFLKSQSDEVLKSKEYEDLFKNQPHVAMELSSLYTQLS